MQRLIEKAQEAYKPYEDIDMLVQSRDDPGGFPSLRKESKLAKDNLDFLNVKLNSSTVTRSDCQPE